MTHAIVVEAVENPTVVAGPYVNMTLLLTAKMSFGPTLGFYRVSAMSAYDYRFTWAYAFYGVRHLVTTEERGPDAIAADLLSTTAYHMATREVTEAVELMLATAELMGYVA